MPHISKYEFNPNFKFVCEYNDNDGISRVDVEKEIEFMFNKKLNREIATLIFKNSDKEGELYTVQQIFAGYKFNTEVIRDDNTNPSIYEIWNFSKSVNSPILNDFVNFFGNFDKYLNDESMKNSSDIRDIELTEMAKILANSIKSNKALGNANLKINFDNLYIPKSR